MLLAFVTRPLIPDPDLQAIADRAHSWTVFVIARSGGEEVTSSGVLLRGGLVLTDLHGLIGQREDGTLAPAEIEVLLDGAGPTPVLLTAGDAALGIAVLKLPDQFRNVAGATVSGEDPQIADELLAMGNDGREVNVLGVKVDHVGPGERLHTSAALPAVFRGGPLFDTRGDLAALSLATGVTRASSLRQLLGLK